MNFVKKLLCTSLLAATAATAGAATFVGNRDDFRDETIYFAMTTRFYDGDQSNNTYCWDGELNVNDPEWRGDFKGLIEKLDYIKALGFTAVWITPVVENASGLDYHGYHAFDFSKVDPRYESTDCKFQDLIDAAHARGMKIILDIVLQHTGNFGEANLCPMFVKDYTQNLSNIDKSMKLHPDSKLPSNYFSLQGAEQYSRRLGLMKNTRGINEDTHNHWHHYAHFNWDDPSRWWGQIAGDCVDLNTENAAVTNYLVDCYGKFIRMGVDGFRIDTGGHISRLTFNNMFLPQFQKIAEEAKAKRNNGPFFMYAEVCARDRNVVYRNHQNCSPFWYTWKESKDYAWDNSTTSWDNIVVMEGEKGSHTNVTSVDKQAADYMADGHEFTSDNAFLKGNAYHKPDYSKFSGLSVIDFPMHWNFRSTREAWGVKYGDAWYNDASYNVTYVDSHDYAPDGAPESTRFDQSQSTWASNLNLMFTFRGIPCIYYGSEIEFRKGHIIDKGPLISLYDSGRAYFGGYITGSVEVNDFADYKNAKGNMAATLSHPLAMHIQRLNQLRAAIPALRKGQYSTEGCSGQGDGNIAFKRRFTDDKTDSYVLVTLGGNATFTGVENGTYTDAITGDVKTVTDGKLSATCSGAGNMRLYVLSTAKTPAPGKVGQDGKYLYDKSAANVAQGAYDGQEEAMDMVTVKETGNGPVGGEHPAEPDPIVEPYMAPGEQAVFFNCNKQWNSVNCYAWNAGTEFFGKWSGSAMTYLGNGNWKITYTGSAVIPETAGLIFNCGGSQTADLTWKNGGLYGLNGFERQIPTNGDPTPPPTPPVEGDYVAYFDNSASNWSPVNVWAWDAAHDSKNYSGGSWPGQSISLDTQSGYYKFACTVTDANPKMMIIFNNGSAQTADLEFHNHGIYNAQGFTGKYYESGVESVAVSHALIYSQAGRLVIDTPTACTVMVARADGSAWYLDAAAGRNEYDLPAGFYIVNGKKIIL